MPCDYSKTDYALINRIISFFYHNLWLMLLHAFFPFKSISLRHEYNPLSSLNVLLFFPTSFQVLATAPRGSEFVEEKDRKIAWSHPKTFI